MNNLEKNPENRASESLSVGAIIEAVEFKEITDKHGHVTGFKSSSPGRKLIEIQVPKGSKPQLEAGRAYKVKIIGDTKPDDPNSGKFVGEIVVEGEPLTAREWQVTEENVSSAERLRRQARSYAGEPGVEIPALSDADRKTLLSIGIEAMADDVFEESGKERAALEEQANELLGDAHGPEQALIRLRMANLKDALRENQALEREEHRVLGYESRVLKLLIDKQNKGAATSREKKALEVLREQQDLIGTAKEKLLSSTPEAWYGLHLKQLKEYKSELESGKIVETEYVKKQAEDIAMHLRAGQPVFIYGELGSGKTEIAFHTARKYFGKEALIISGSKHTSPSELYGHQILSLRDVDNAEAEDQYRAFLKTAEDEINDWKEEHPKATEEEIGRQFELIRTGLQERLAHEFRSGTVSDYFMGQVYQAMAEGRPIILDEVNAIPHEVLISLNHLLTRRPGDKVRIQQNSGSEVVVHEGFGFILTGNINETGDERYIMRQDLDPAFISRLY
ncbi:MAG TPA: AAA family ATPase, partial [Candidatus Paceibacterota bacterium]|nr:AAA family ATPase [Candidatus Paceibacterota bacterium]